MQEHVMSEEMKLFFSKLLELRDYAKEQSKEMDHAGAVYDFFYEQLDAIIKDRQ